LKVINL